MSGWNLGELFRAVVDTVGEREAVVSGTTRLTYDALDARVNRLAHWLAHEGIGPGEHIGLALRNGNEYLEAMLAAFTLGAVPVNVNTRYTTGELRYLFDDADLRLVIHEPDLADAVTEAVGIDPGSPGRTLARGRAYEAALASSEPGRPDLQGRSGDDRYILYTGGTTGMPKGVVWRHEDIFHAAFGGGNPGGTPIDSLADLAALARTGRVRCLPVSPFTHGTAHWTAFSTLFGGGTVVVSCAPAFDPVSIWSLAEIEAVTLLVIVGDAFARPLADALDRHGDRWDLSSLLLVVSGGAVLSPAVRQSLLAHLSSTVVVDGYGTSETGGHGHMAVWPGAADAGLPRFEVGDDTAVLDSHLDPVRPGSGDVGLVARRGPIPLRYHGDPDRSAITFRSINGERWAVPGDLAIVEEDGRITLLGRGSGSINTGGEKVFPDEVEATLKAHPAVFDAVVMGVSDERWGQRVTAVVQARDDRPVDAGELTRHCRSHLAPFKVPRQVVFVDELVRRSSGKPDYTWAAAVLARTVEGATAPTS